MPGNLQTILPSGVMPFALCTAFTESREYVQLQTQYHDGTIQRSQLSQTSRHTFTLAQRLKANRDNPALAITPVKKHGKLDGEETMVLPG